MWNAKRKFSNSFEINGLREYFAFGKTLEIQCENFCRILTGGNWRPDRSEKRQGLWLKARRMFERNKLIIGNRKTICVYLNKGFDKFRHSEDASQEGIP